MLLINLALFTAIGLAIAASAAYIVHRVRRVNREACLREQRRAAALLAEIGAAPSPGPRPTSSPALPAKPLARADVAPPDRLDDALSSFFPPAAPAPAPAPPVADPAMTTSARDLAARLRAAADRIEAIAADTSLTTEARSEAIVALATEATSPAALRPVIMAARPSTGPA